MTVSTQNGAVSKKMVHLLHSNSAETAADRGNILLAPTMHAIIEALTHGIKPEKGHDKRGEAMRRTKTKGKKTERTPGINIGQTKTRTGDRHKVNTQNTGSERYT